MRDRSRILLLLILIFSLSLIVFSGHGEETPENLLANPEFEDLDDRGVPAGWVTDAYIQEVGYTQFSIEEGKPEDPGSRVLKIHNMALNDARLAQTVEVEPESMYRFSAYVRPEKVEEGHGANLSVEGVYAFSEELFDTESGWSHITWYGETGEEQRSVTLFLRLGGYSGESVGTAYFTCPELEKVEKLPDDVIAARWFKAPTQAKYEDEADSEKAGAVWPMLSALVCLYVIIAMLAEQKARKYQLPSRKESARADWLFAAGMLLALGIRILLSARIAGYQVDVNCFTSWGNTMLQVGPGAFYGTTSFCDYPPAYLYVLGLNAWLCETLHASSALTSVIYRLVPCLCDVLTCIALYAYGRKKRIASPTWCSVVLVLMALLPVTILNSAAWGQMDSVLSFLLVLVTLLVLEEQWHLVLPCYILAVLVKPQALMLGFLGLTVLIVEWLRKKEARRRMLIGLGLSALVAAVILIPFSGQQQPGWLIQLYGNTLSSYPYATVNTANLAYVFGGNWEGIEAAAPFWANLLMAFFCTAYGLGWHLKSQRLRLSAAWVETALSGIGAAWFVFCAVSGASWTLTGIGAMAFPFCIVLSLYIRKGDRRFLPFCGSLLFLLLYVFGIKMHERYVIPAFFLMMIACMVHRDRRIWLLLLLSSACVFLNEGIVLDNSMRLGSSLGHLNQDTVWLASLLSLIQILCTLYAVWTGMTISLSEETNELFPLEHVLPVRQLQIVPATVPARDKKLNWNRKDTALLLGITTVYTALTLLTLGSTRAPQTAWTSSGYDEAVVFDLGEDTEDLTILYFAQVSRYDFSFAQSTDGIHWSDEVYAQMNQGECWKWKYVVQYTTDEETEERHYYDSGMDHVVRFSGRYIRLTAHQVGLKLNEVLFRKADGSMVPVRGIERTGGNADSELYSAPALLSDEQDTLEALPQWFPDPEGQEIIHMAQPSWWNSTYFDEIYHARTAYEFLQGTVPYETTHPPLGKVLMSWGIVLFGMTPFGWRFAGAVAGILMLPGMYLLTKQLTRKTHLAALACLLMATDCQHLTQTQIATIDSFPVLFIIFAFFFMLRFLQTDLGSATWKRILPDLAFSGLFMGLSIASKWIGIYAGAGLAVLFFWHCLRSLLAAGRESPDRLNDLRKKTLRICLWCVLFFVVVPLAIYLASYIPYMAYNQNLNGIGDYVRAVYQAQINMFTYHSTDQRGMDHPFYSPWWEWPVMARPMYYASESYETGNGLFFSIFCFGNPVVWFGGLFAVALCAMFWAGGKRYRLEGQTEKWHWRQAGTDHSAAFILISLGAQYLPWVLVPRGTYIYHYFASVPFLILATAYCFSRWEDRHARSAKIGLFCLGTASVIAFIYFFPYASGILAPEIWMEAGKRLLRIYY